MGLLATPLCDGTDSELDAESNGHPDMIKDINSIYPQKASIIALVCYPPPQLKILDQPLVLETLLKNEDSVYQFSF